jgi:choline kinase
MTLLVLAAGMGSRYGGVKQIAEVGEHGEIIIDYSCFDAIEAGFKNIIFVIRESIESDFREKFFDRFQKQIHGKATATYCFQTTPDWREKPLGTTDAILSAKDLINESFCVINADDFYGKGAFKRAITIKGNGIIAYKVYNTLSEFGEVKRHVITTDDNGNAWDFTETLISKSDIPSKIPQDTLVNMNFFVFTTETLPMFQQLRDNQVKEFEKSNDQKNECMMPSDVGYLIQSGKIKLELLQPDGDDEWIGLTYIADLAEAKIKIKKLISDGIYKSPLWD